MTEIVYRPIGIIRTPFQEPGEMPIQPRWAEGARGTVVLEEELRDGLADLDGFSHILLLYHLHRAGPPQLRVVPFLDTRERGVFATRAPVRPNPIGLSVVRLLRVSGAVLEIGGVDILDGTPLLDVKPYVPDFDTVDGFSTGWLAERDPDSTEGRSDGRFAPGEGTIT